MILFYNILLKEHKDQTDQPAERFAEREMIEKLIDILNTTIMDFFEDSMIVNVVMQLITLFTSKSDNPSLFDHPKILNYVFTRMTDKEADASDETIKLTALAMSRISSRFDATKFNIDLYIKELEEYDNFEYVMSLIKRISQSDQGQNMTE